MNVYTTGPRSSSRAVVVMTRKKDPQKQIYPDYLVHYGIFGQKWGVRRYQNEDGTLTEEGKQRYNQKPESEEWKKSDAEHLSDEELRRRNNRLQAERQYKELTTSQVERERIQRRKDIINKVIVGTAVSLAAVAMRGRWKQAASFIGKHGKQLISKIKAPVAKSLSQKNINAQSITKAASGAAERYAGLNRPPIGARQWGPMSLIEVMKGKR